MFIRNVVRITSHDIVKCSFSPFWSSVEDSELKDSWYLGSVKVGHDIHYYLLE